MLGFRSSGKKSEVEDPENVDVAKLFFDSFSKRVTTVEDSLRKMSADFDKLKLSLERGQISDLVLLDRLQKMENLMSEGPKSAPEIGRAIGRSREHTARLMKKLHEEGYVRRDQTRIPFRYSAVDRLKQVVKKPETKDEGKEPISVPQT